MKLVKLIIHIIDGAGAALAAAFMVMIFGLTAFFSLFSSSADPLESLVFCVPLWFALCMSFFVIADACINYFKTANKKRKLSKYVKTEIMIDIIALIVAAAIFVSGYFFPLPLSSSDSEPIIVIAALIVLPVVSLILTPFCRGGKPEENKD